MDHRFAHDTVVQAAIHVHFNPLGTEVTEVAMQSNTNRWVGHFALRTVEPVENQEPVARRWRSAFVAGVAALVSVCGGDANAQRPVVPGTGTELVGVADDFEDESWRYVPNNPKSTEDIDENQRAPMGKAPTAAGTKASNAATRTWSNESSLLPADCRAAKALC